MELIGAVQKYEWGKIGKSSSVAVLHSSNDPHFCIEENKPYSELWMGTHPNAPSVIKSTGQELQHWIIANKKCLGPAMVNYFGVKLPFLFKVLSVNKALSVQAHPTKAHAEKLHKSFPHIYKDPNHKPELAIALTPFQALCDFRPIAEIKKFLQDIVQLRTVIGEELASTFIANTNVKVEKKLLKECFQQVMKCPSDIVVKQLESLIKDLNQDPATSPTKTLMKTLHAEFPGDVGCFCIYFLNHLLLNPGESIYLAPNIPHAYLYGDCVECMSSSDNVIRAGLTPKYRDVETLCEMLQYEPRPASSVKFQPSQEDPCTLLYRVDVPDFAVAKITIPSDMPEYSMISRRSASILLVIDGKGDSGLISLKPGSILFLCADEQLKIKSHTTAEKIHGKCSYAASGPRAELRLRNTQPRSCAQPLSDTTK